MLLRRAVTIASRRVDNPRRPARAESMTKMTGACYSYQPEIIGNATSAGRIFNFTDNPGNLLSRLATADGSGWVDRPGEIYQG